MLVPDALVARGHTAELSNTVVWVLLGAAEEGELEMLREEAAHSHQHDEYPHGSDPRCAWPPGRTHDVMNVRTLRCVRFLTSLLASTASAVSNLLEATKVNLQLEHALNLPIGTVAQLLGVADVHQREMAAPTSSR